MRNGIYPLTAFGLPGSHQPQQEVVKSPIATPSVKSPTPEPTEMETRKVGRFITVSLYPHTSYQLVVICFQMHTFDFRWCD